LSKSRAASTLLACDGCSERSSYWLSSRAGPAACSRRSSRPSRVRSTNHRARRARIGRHSAAARSTGPSGS